MFVYFTRLTSRDVYDRHNRWIGRPYDFCVRPQEAYPPLTGLMIPHGHLRVRYALVPWDQVTVSDGNGHDQPSFQLKVALEQLEYHALDTYTYTFRLRRHVLYQQVVDTFNR